MKIAYIIPKLVNQGPIIVVRELVKLMIKYNHSCTVYYFDDGDEIKLNCPSFKQPFYKSINFNLYDVIHTHGLRPDLYIFLHKPNNCKCKIISTLHNYIFPDLAFQYNKLISYTFGYLWIKFLSKHDKLIVLSKDAKMYYSKWFNKEKLTYIYNTRIINQRIVASREEEEIILNFKQNKILIGVNAALTHRKGIDQIIKILKKLPNHKLLIVGDGKSKQDLINLCKSCQVTEQVLFLGYKKDAYKFLPYYDIFALPSRSEGFGLTLLESAIYKRNVICSDIPIFRELATESEVVFFKLENSVSLIKAINEATTSKQYGINLFNKYINTYSPIFFYQKHIDTYQSLKL